MLGEVVVAVGRCSPGTHTAGDSSDGECESKETEGRDVEKDVHAYLKKDNKVRGFLQLIQSCGGFGRIFRWTGAYQGRNIPAARMCVCFCEGRRYELGTPHAERGFPP